MHIALLITMTENEEKHPGADLQAMLDTVDFKKVAEMSGIPAVGMVEQAKLMQLQLEYFMHLEEMLFEMQSMSHIARFGIEPPGNMKNTEKDRSYKTVYKMYFPNGREYYKKAIRELEQSINTPQPRTENVKP